MSQKTVHTLLQHAARYYAEMLS